VIAPIQLLAAYLQPLSVSESTDSQTISPDKALLISVHLNGLALLKDQTAHIA
jgi:hypothetical protein